MKLRNDKYIDDLFRKGLGNGAENTGSITHDWTVMEKRLDERDRRRRFFFLIGSLSGVAFIGLLALLLWPVSVHHPKQFSDHTIINKQKAVSGEVSVNQQDHVNGRIPDSKLNSPDKVPVIHEANTFILKRNRPVAEKDKVFMPVTTDDVNSADLKDLALSKKQSANQAPQNEDDNNTAAHLKDRSTSKTESANLNPQNEDDKNTAANAIDKDKEAAGNTRDKHAISQDNRTAYTHAVSQDNKTTDTVTKTSNQKADDSTSVKKPKIEKQRKSNLYYGVVIGPDLSMIKSQRVKNLGYSAGLMLGYHFNKHWAAEAGAIWTSKKYYTEGKYFDKAGTDIPSSANLIDLDGSCGMLTFPISARYDLFVGRNSFFATAGLNSYIMKKEDYSYTAETGVSTYQGYRSYKNSGNYFFANLQFSAGYNYSLSSKVKLRVEPYIDVPLKKIGTGRMPLTSTGLYLGIIRDLK